MWEHAQHQHNSNQEKSQQSGWELATKAYSEPRSYLQLIGALKGKKYQFFSIECHWIYKLYLRLRSSCPIQIVIHDFCFVLFSSFFLFWFGFVYVYLIVCYYCFVFNREKGREVGWEELGEVGGGERMCSNILDETLKEYIKALKE